MFSNEDINCRRKFKRKKRRRTNEKMKTIIKKIEKEIESQLDVKNEKNDFTTTNIEAILKEVIMDEDIKEMVRQTLRLQGSSKCPYEPKLTRAKIRELLKLRPDLSFPILWPIPTKKNINFVSECLTLINENYSENSSEDEEYKPSNDSQEEDERACSDGITGLPPDIVEISRNASSSMDLRCTNVAHCSKKQEENIGQRTRSKLPLIDTPLEVIEQAFVPPDITIDMYESECDNQDWLDFIKGFVQPLDCKCSEPTDFDDDLDDDPEYNILADEETVDREELRKDRAVEVPRKEVNDLIAELLKDCDPINSMIAEKKNTGDSLQLRHENIVSAKLPENDTSSLFATIPISDDKTPTRPVQQKTVHAESIISAPTLLSPQRQLLNQQMQQHIQMTTMHFLQFHKHPIYHYYANLMKAMIYSIKKQAVRNRNSAFFAINLDSALQLIQDWEKFREDVPHPKFNVFRRASRTSKEPEQFSQDLMKVVSMSDVFLYPLLLPRQPFSSSVPLTTYSTTLTSSEEWLLAIGLEEFFDYIKYTEKPKNENIVLKKAVALICRYLLPCFTETFLCNYIKKRRMETKKNHIKEFFENGKVPPLKHYVIPVHRNPLFKQPLALLPDVWTNYIKNNYMVVKVKS